MILATEVTQGMANAVAIIAAFMFFLGLLVGFIVGTERERRREGGDE